LKVRACLFLLLLSTLSISFGLNARGYFSNIERLNVQHGLPANTIYTIQKDLKGFLWLGTPNGLARYDGYKFENHSNEPNGNKKILTQSASNILLDSQQRLWVGSWGEGVTVYDANLNPIMQFSYDEMEPGSIRSNLIQVIYEDSDGDIWIGTNGGGLSWYQTRSQSLLNFQHEPQSKESLSHNRVWDIEELSKGEIMIATEGGLDRLNKNQALTITHYPHLKVETNNPEVKRIRVLHAANNGLLWLGTEEGIITFNIKNKVFTPIKLHGKQNVAAITSMTESTDGELWIGTKNGVYLYDTKQQSFISLVGSKQFNILSQDDIRDLLVDESGILWAATRAGGLIKVVFSPNAFQSYSSFRSASNETENIGGVLTLFMDSKDTLWVGTTNGLLIKKPQEDILQQFISDSTTDLGVIYSMIESRDQKLWFATTKGLFSLPIQENGLGRLEQIGEGSLVGGANTLLEDSKGNIWIGTMHQGLFKYDGVSFSHQEHTALNNQAVKTNTIQAIVEDARGHIWVGTNGEGLSRIHLRTKVISSYMFDSSASTSLSGNEISDLYYSKSNTLWIGTNNKLNKLDSISNEFRYFGKEQGLLNNTVNAIIEDKYNNLWVSTGFGLARLKSGQPVFNSYTKENGLHGNEFLIRSSAIGRNGDLYFGGVAGFTKVITDNLQINQIPPEVTITGIWLDQVKHETVTYNENPKLILDYRSKDIVISYTTLDFLTTKNNKYSYKLAGYNENWSMPTNENKTSYSGLSPGEYVFEVRGSNSNGVWSEDTTKISIRILPPWWLTWWFKLIVLLVFLTSVHYWNRKQKRKLEKQNKLLEQEVNSRSNQLFNVHKQLVESEKNSSLSSLVTGVAHEINTPVGVSLTASTMLVDSTKLLLTQYQNNTIKKSEFETTLNNLHDCAEMIVGNLSRASNLVNSFKELSIDQSSGQKRKFNLNHYLEEIFIGLRARLNENNIAVEIICSDNIEILSYPGAYTEIVTQLTINALNHAFEGVDKGKVVVSVELVDDKINMVYKDNGKGIPKNVKNRIFEPFFTTKRGEGAKGLGLQVVANIVTIRLGGIIHCHSTENEGTSFEMQFAASPI
jgi:ligand-binding sensor domain-containing protein/signal transduction histidine kinase